MRLTAAINATAAINRLGVNVATVLAVPTPPKVVVDAVVLGKTPNRRERKAYNDYMREYMKKKRAGFIGIPYG